VRRFATTTMLALSAMLLLSTATHAGNPIVKEVPIVITAACTEGRTIKPEEGKWVSVQAGPSADHVSIDILFKSVKVWTCGRQGDFFAVVYDHAGERTCKPPSSSKPYKGPCAYGWMYAGFLEGARTSHVPDENESKVTGTHMLRLCKSSEPSQREFCRGFALGIAFMSSEQGNACLTNVTANELRDVATRFMEDMVAGRVMGAKPEDMKHGAWVIFDVAYSRAWPCKKGTP
jgi:hypothetical protein